MEGCGETLGPSPPPCLPLSGHLSWRRAAGAWPGAGPAVNGLCVGEVGSESSCKENSWGRGQPVTQEPTQQPLLPPQAQMGRGVPKPGPTSPSTAQGGRRQGRALRPAPSVSSPHTQLPPQKQGADRCPKLRPGMGLRSAANSDQRPSCQGTSQPLCCVQVYMCIRTSICVYTHTRACHCLCVHTTGPAGAARAPPPTPRAHWPLRASEERGTGGRGQTKAASFPSNSYWAPH